MFKTTTLIAAGLAAARIANAQSAIAAVTGGSESNGDCGGCYVVADVAGIAFGTDINTATATNQVIIQNGRNSTFTTTSLIFNQAQFTIAPVTGVVAQTPGPAQASPINVDQSTLVVSGVTLTSPTAYNVFTAYSLTSYELTDGGCRLVQGSATTLPSAYSVPVPAGVNYQSFAIEAQKSFVKNLGLVPTCSAGGENLTPTAIIPQSVVTTSVTTTARASLTPLSALGSTTARTTAGPTGATSPYSTLMRNGTAAGTINIAGASGRGSIAIAGADRAQVGSWLAGAAAVLMGLVA